MGVKCERKIYPITKEMLDWEDEQMVKAISTEGMAEFINNPPSWSELSKLVKRKPKPLGSKLLIHVPHSSTYIPNEYKKTCLLSQRELDKENEFMCDTGIINLIPPEFMENTLIFPYSRLYCDVERFRDGSEPMDKYGMGYIYTHDSKGRKMFEPTEEHIARVNAIYEKHHAELDRRVKQIIDEHGECILIDLHSFSDETVKRLFGYKNCPDICIGIEPDYNSHELSLSLERIFKALGMFVLVNYPYRGSIVPNAYYGKKNTSLISIMIEVNKRVLG